MDRVEFAAWLRLLETPGVGRDTARRLLAGLGSPEQVLAASPANLRHYVDESTVRALAQAPLQFDERLKAALDWLAGGPRRRVLTLADADYPPALLQSADPPLLLYVAGDFATLATPSVAVVGSRRATPQGLENARRFARTLAEAGIAVVSGLALGIDGAAHQGALDAQVGADVMIGPTVGSTVAVVGTGLDIVYPKRHHALAHAVAERGALVSEYAPGTPSMPEHFPQRNRIIATLTRGTLVVEAALQSGSLITARLASEAGREVWAIPGSIHTEQARGCHALIRQGAALVESPQEIIDEVLGLASRNVAAPAQDKAVSAGAAPSPADAILQSLGGDPVSLDVLLARTGETVERLSARLLELELDGQLQRLPGGLYQRLVSG